MTPAEELRLSNRGQLELLRGVVARGAMLRTGVLGRSMTPFVRDRDVVTIAPLRGKPPRVGDVVAIAVGEPERLVLHRVVARRGEAFSTRGDACPSADGVVTAREILGRVVRTERAGRAVRIGTSSGRAGGALVAAASRSGALAAAAAGRRRVRAAAGAGARRVQSAQAYRRAGRKMARAVTIEEAFDGATAARGPEGSAGVTEWVARRRGRQVGSVQLVVQADGAGPWAGLWLTSLVVSAAWRGLGVGECLTRAVVARACRDGAPELLLAVQAHNARAIALYRKLGFEDVVVPALEPLLVEEGERLGRRRVVMRLPLPATS